MMSSQWLRTNWGELHRKLATAEHIMFSIWAMEEPTNGLDSSL